MRCKVWLFSLNFCCQFHTFSKFFLHKDIYQQQKEIRTLSRPVSAKQFEDISEDKENQEPLKTPRPLSGNISNRVKLRDKTPAQQENNMISKYLEMEKEVATRLSRIQKQKLKEHEKCKFFSFLNILYFMLRFHFFGNICGVLVRFQRIH